MKKLLIRLFILLAFFISAAAGADEVLKATSEDLKEFDHLLIQAKAKKNEEQKKLITVVPEKKQDIQNNHREHFQNNILQEEKKLHPLRPFDHRPLPGAFSPGDNRMAPPPPPPYQPPREPGQTGPPPH